ncbi:MAG: hypothetical protein Q8K02_05825 [Flavobacterium sp.]|nr:hypothetical protein [Flavobacterium sp.]
MSELKLNSNVAYSTYDLTLNYEGIGYVHNTYLYNCFQLINRIGEDKTINKLKEIAIEETKLGIDAGVYPEGSNTKIVELYDLFERFENDSDQLINELKIFYNKVLSDKKFNDTLVLAFANLSLHSVIFWSNFEKDNSTMLRGRGRTVFIAASDVLGGVTAAWHGSKAGATVGAVFGNPVAGILIGGIGGLLLGGIVASGTAYYASR